MYHLWITCYWLADELKSMLRKKNSLKKGKHSNALKIAWRRKHIQMVAVTTEVCYNCFLRYIFVDDCSNQSYWSRYTMQTSVVLFSQFPENTTVHFIHIYLYIIYLYIYTANYIKHTKQVSRPPSSSYPRELSKLNRAAM